MQNWNGLMNMAKGWTTKHMPDILTGLGIFGFGMAVYHAAKDTPKAKKCIEDEKKRLKVKSLSPSQTLAATWKVYVPTVGYFIAGSACVIGSDVMNNSRNVKLAAAYTLADTTLREYQTKVIDTIGEKKEQAIRDEIAKDKVAANLPAPGTLTVIEGKMVCYIEDDMSNPFISDVESIRSAVNDINDQRIRNMEPYISLNDLFEAVGAQCTQKGDEYGWTDEMIEQPYFTYVPQEDGSIYVVVRFRAGNEPKLDFRRLVR